MVARITTPKRIMDALNYNEQKVKKGIAECIAAGNYLRDLSSMNFYQKLAGIENRNVLNDRATTKTLHVSLNFDPSEKLSNETLTAIADIYMDKIGFAQQPYLVYKHFDAGHPHVHIVSTTIKADGSRINTHNIGRNQSEKARKEIEDIFRLVKANKENQNLNESIKPLDPIKINYGKSETKRSITNILNVVVNNYRYISIMELNAALKQFNVIADRGKVEGRVYKNRGLLYCILDANGNKIGVPIKASSISNKPTLDYLEKKFEENKIAREPFKTGLKKAIDEVFANVPGSMKEIIAELTRKQVFTILRQNVDGRIYGITFVDNKNKCVFNGSDLGKGYSAAALQSRLVAKEEPKDITLIENRNSGYSNFFQEKEIHKIKEDIKPIRNENLLEQLLSPKEQNENAPWQLRKKKRKKKKRDFE